MNFTVIVLSGIDRNLSIALSVSSAWNPPFIRLLGPPLYHIVHDEFEKLKKTKLTSGMFQIFSFVFQRKGCHRYVIF